MADVSAFAPGRVNLIGDHTDHTGGRCLPMALSMGVTVRGTSGGDRVRLRSESAHGTADLPLRVEEPSQVSPEWARYVAGVVAELEPEEGLDATVVSDLPMGAGLSSSAALEVAAALALGADDDPLALAQRCRRAEHRASGVPCGILDQLTSVAGVADHALLLDCRSLTWEAVPVPASLAIVIVHSGQERTLAGSAYAERRAECDAAEALIGPLRDATLEDVATIGDPVLMRRARHVVTENQRVDDAAQALAADDRRTLGSLLDQSHRSLRDDFEVSTAVVDALVDRLRSRPGVHGVRISGGGFGGCVVAVAEHGAIDEGWSVRPGSGAHRR